MAKGNRRLRSVVEGAVEATKDARRAAAAEKIRASVVAPPPAPSPAPAPTPAPKPAPAKPKRTRAKPAELAVEPDTRLDATAEQRVPETAVDSSPVPMTPEEAQQLRDTMLQSGRPKKRASPKPAKPQAAPKPDGFAPIRGPGALLGRLLKETYRQAPNIAANAVAIPAFTAAGAGGAYLGTAGTLAAIRGINKLLAPSASSEEPKEPLALPAPTNKPTEENDYRTGFQRAIDQRRKPSATDGGFDVIRSLSRTRGLS